jgi:enoyl-CoA hydratase
MSNAILQELRPDGILILTINRPEAYNALNKAFFDTMDSILDDIYSNTDIKSVILTGSGEKAFAAGADIKAFSSFNENQAKKLSRDGQNVMNRMENCPKPILAAVNGFSLGGGCELAMCCHMRIASDNALFGQPEVNLGLIPGYGGTQRLVQLIGKGKAMELLMTADNIKADEALKLGLVNYVVAKENLLAACIELLTKINSKAPLAIGKIVECVNSYYKDGIIGYQTEINNFAELFETDDFKEGVVAFIEKRKAMFTGK